MSETTRQDLDALRDGLRLVEEWRKTHEDRARMARVDATAEMERRKAGAYAAVAAVVRRELEALESGDDVRERVAREIREAAWADPTGLRERQNAEALADRILALLRTPRGEGEAAAMSANLARALAAMQAAWIEWRRGRGADAAMQWIENTLIGPGLIPGDDESDAQAFFDRAIAEIENHQIRHAAALRSDAQGEARPRTSCDWMDYLECLLEDHVGAHDPATCCDVDDDEACCTTCALYRLHQRKPWRAAHPTDRSESDGE